MRGKLKSTFFCHFERSEKFEDVSLKQNKNIFLVKKNFCNKVVCRISYIFARRFRKQDGE